MIDIGKQTSAPAVTRSSGSQPKYTLYLGDIDEMIGKVLTAASINSKFFTSHLNEVAREYLIEENWVSALTAM